VRRLLWPVLLIATSAAILTVAVPTLTIHPFRPQTTSGVALSYELKRVAPMVTAIALVIVVMCAAILWPGAKRWRWWRRSVIVLLVGMTGIVTWFARQNHFEWMFNPLAKSEYVSVPEARTFLVDAEIVMGIDVNGVALAYPIRQLAYHHLVNEQIGGTPLVVTY
jgi:type IV secretory pathway VirB2 component (pilin)